MPLQLDMHKSAGALRLTLEKAGIATPPVVDVAFDLDVSHSYGDEHRDGSTNDLLARLVPWGLVFDPDRKLDVFTFSDGPRHAHYVGPVTEHNCAGFVQRQVVQQVPGWGGGTHYSPVLRRNLEHFGWVPRPESWLGGLARRALGQGTTQPAPPRKSLVLFNTDGATQDEHDTYALLEEMEQRQFQMYVLFIAYANGGADFRFLERVARRFANTGLHVLRRLPDFTRASDEQINQWLVTPELLDWLRR